MQNRFQSLFLENDESEVGKHVVVNREIVFRVRVLDVRAKWCACSPPEKNVFRFRLLLLLLLRSVAPVASRLCPAGNTRKENGKEIWCGGGGG